MPEIRITLENDPVPIVLMIGKFLTGQMQVSRAAEAANAIRGNIALQSTTDPQAVTLRFSAGEITLSRGVAPDSKLTIELDFNRMADPSMKPKVVGLFKHPLLAMRMGQLMASAPAQDWTILAHRYWSLIQSQPGIPVAMSFSSTDQNKSVIVGSGNPEFDIEGPSPHLATFLSGDSVLIQDIITKQLFMKGSFEHLSVLSGLSLDMLLGELKEEDAAGVQHD